GEHPCRARRLRSQSGERRQRAGLHLRRAERDRHRAPAGGPYRSGNPFQGPADHAKLAGGHIRRSGEGRAMNVPAPAKSNLAMNLHAVKAIYRFEMARTGRTLMQSIISPVISTALYFIVFGAAIGSRIQQIEGVSYGAFLVPGLIMLSLLTQSISNA